MLKKSRDSAFTLIELMVSVAIIGILASVAIPSFKGYIMRAKSAEVYTLLPQLAQSLQVYYETEFCGQGLTGTYIGPMADNEGACPTHCVTNWGWTPNVNTEGPEPTVIDWATDCTGPSCEQTFPHLDFMPADPIYFSYVIWSSQMTMFPALASLTSACGHNDDGAGYTLWGMSDLDGDSLVARYSMQMFINDGKWNRTPAITKWDKNEW